MYIQWFGQIYDDKYLPFLNHIELFPSWKFLHSLIILPSVPSPWKLLDCFIVSMILPFPQYHIIRIMHYISFSNWVLSLNKIYLSFLHVILWFDNLFLFLFKFLLFIWAYNVWVISTPLLQLVSLKQWVIPHCLNVP
jgi:hypothetical protein